MRIAQMRIARHTLQIAERNMPQIRTSGPLDFSLHNPEQVSFVRLLWGPLIHFRETCLYDSLFV